MRLSSNPTLRATIAANLSFVLAVLLLQACNSSDGFESPTAPAPAPPPPTSNFTPGADLSGAWVGSYTSLADGVDQLADATYPGAATIQQSAANVTAQLEVRVASDTGVYTFVGFMDGMRIWGTINGMRAEGGLEGGQLTIRWAYNRWDLHR